MQENSKGFGNSYDHEATRRFFGRWWKVLLIVFVVGAAGSAVAAWCIKPLYKSSAVIFPTNSNRLSKAIMDNELWKNNKDFIAKWLPKAKQNPLFFGAKAKLEWQAGQPETPNLWDHIMQIRPSGLRVKPGTYFPALVAITQTSIVGKRKRFLTPRECARLQSFPDSFIYDDKDTQAYKQFGNGINVELVSLFARYMFGDEDIREQFSLAQQGRSKKTSIKKPIDTGPTLFDRLFD